MNKVRILSLCRAVSRDDTITEDDIELKTLDNTYDNGKNNDVAFIYKNKLVVMFEHQSTINENMLLQASKAAKLYVWRYNIA